MTTRHREPTLPPTRPLAILDAAGRPLWAALGGPGYAYDDRLEALWRAGQRAARGIITLRLGNTTDLAWAQAHVTAHHYLHTPVDVRCSPIAYIVSWHQDGGLSQAVGCLIVGRPESTRCYDGGLTYGSQADVAAGRAQYNRWEVLNLARVWLSPIVQPGGALHGPAYGLPGYTDRRGVWRSTLASWAIDQALARVGFDYLQARPPVDCSYPYQIRALLSYCDRRLHRGTIYRAAGFQLARTNARGIETWYTPSVAPLSAEQDVQVRRLAELAPRSQRIRSQRMKLRLFEFEEEKS